MTERGRMYWWQHLSWGAGAVVLVALVASVALVALAAWLVFVAPRAPATHREWAADHARLAHATLDGDSVVTVRDLRDFTYTSETTYSAAYHTRQYDLTRLASAWFVLTPFSTTWRGPAHAFVSFGFSDGEYVAISVEARRETGERYSVLAGLLRNFEVAYIIGTERDLIGRRALYDGDDVYLYPIATSPERARTMFVEMLERANALQRNAEFYNTLTNNCTSNLVAHVNRMVPGRIPSSIRTVLPGYADALALSLGLIGASGTLDEVRARYRINDRARAAGLDGDFSAAIRAWDGGRARHGTTGR